MSDLNEHRRAIIGARRRNNIYGEISDFIVMEILSLGCDAAIYNPCENENTPITIYAKSNEKMYFIKLFYQENSDEKVVAADHVKHTLRNMAEGCNAVPVYGIVRNYARNVKFFNMNDKKLVRM